MLYLLQVNTQWVQQQVHSPPMHPQYRATAPFSVTSHFQPMSVTPNLRPTRCAYWRWWRSCSG